MVYILATIANDADYTPSLLYALGNQLEVPRSEHTAETWGVGYYADARALIIRKPAEIVSSRTVYELAPEVKSKIVLSCVLGNGTLDQAPPYRTRRWLFGYSGDLSPLGDLHNKIVEKLPDFVGSDITQNDGGQLAFGMFIAELHRSGHLDDPIVKAKVLGGALARTADMINRLCVEAKGAPVKASYVATNGRFVLAYQSGVPLFWKLQEGLEALPEGPPDPDLTDFKQIAADLKRFRAVVLVHGADPAPEWSEIGDGKVFIVDGQLETEHFDGP